MSYTLDGNGLPRPKRFKRGFVSIVNSLRGMTGKQGRDYRTRKERFTLGWDNLSASEVSTILTILEKNAPVIFSVDETNLSIPETTVIVKMDGVGYSMIGEDYRASVGIVLEEEL